MGSKTACRKHRACNSFGKLSNLFWISGLLGIVGAAHAGDPVTQTLEDMQTVGIAMVAWQIDQLVERPVADQRPMGFDADPEAPGPAFDVTNVPIITDVALEALLVPDYLSALPTTDGWGNAFEFRLDTVDPGTLPVIAIRSAGSDGGYSGTIYNPGFTAVDTEDLVWMDGTFIRRSPPSASEAPAYTTEILAQISTAFQSWRTDQVGSAPPSFGPAASGIGADPTVAAGLTGCDSHMVDVSNVTSSTAAALEALLVPGYILFLPQEDGWQNALEFRLDTSLSADSNWLAVRSPGSDGIYSGTTYTAGINTVDTEDLVQYDAFAIRRAAPPAGQEVSEIVFEQQVIGGAMFSWLVDNLIREPKASRADLSKFDTGDLVPITHTTLEGLLQPFYIPCLPRRDFWGNEYDFWLNTGNLFSIPLMGIRSRGSDDLADAVVYSPGPFPSVETENDILWVDGVFIRYPDPVLFFNDGFESGDTTAWDSAVP